MYCQSTARKFPIIPRKPLRRFSSVATHKMWSFEALGDGRYLIKTTEMITCFLERKIIRCVHPMPNLLLEWERMDPVNGLWRKSTRAAVFIRFINLTHPRDGRSTAIGSALHSQVIPMATDKSWPERQFICRRITGYFQRSKFVITSRYCY
ncbi:uncharacterized protein DFL_005144 [Arthrobotrys flagrans]|uniref:Uncharacterized protein n=1 Tax=Arthrobotrys flagrans TaxID=97331 RepID=A0A437A6W1_ARTFL|nr:hypothetical protein DFL_005144 [Arthrobotrys flagrans]